MKRLSVLILFMLGAVLVFAQTPEASIREMTGTVELKTPDSADWKPAQRGDLLERATIISTGFKSTAILAVGNSTLTVRPLTRLSLEELVSREETETINIGLRTGRIQVNVNPPAGSKTDFTVRTPVATASVRGTIFDIDPLNVKVVEGTVMFTPVSAVGLLPVQVNAGQSSQVESDTGQAANPVVVAETNRNLPALTGQEAATDTGAAGGVSQGTTQGTGTLEIGKIIITPKTSRY